MKECSCHAQCERYFSRQLVRPLFIFSAVSPEATREINDSVTDTADDADDKGITDPEIIKAADQIANDPMLFRKKIDIVNQLGVINERKNIGLYQLVIDSRLLPMGSAGSDALAMKNSGHYGASKSYPLVMSLKLYPDKQLQV